MNPVFWILVIIVGFLIWAFLSTVFIPLGKFIYCRWNTIKEKINKEYEEKKEKQDEVR